MKKRPKNRTKRRSSGDPLVLDLAGFLNLDMKRADDIKTKWHLYQGVLRFGVPGGDGLSAEDMMRCKELKLLVGLLEESDLYSADLMDRLETLQEQVKTDLNPFLKELDGKGLSASERKEEEERLRYGIRGRMRELVAMLNALAFRSQWALYSLGEITGRGWLCTYDPKDPSSVSDADPDLITQQKILRIGDYRYVIKQTSPRTPRGTDSIRDRLYWIIGQTLINATIGTLRICVECKKYFAAHDSKQICCSKNCYRVRNGRSSSARAALSRKRKRQRLQNK